MLSIKHYLHSAPERYALLFLKKGALNFRKSAHPHAQKAVARADEIVNVSGASMEPQVKYANG